MEVEGLALRALLAGVVTQEAKVRSRKILTNCLALHALIALFPIPRAAANPLITQPLIPGSTSNASPGVNDSDMGTGRASHPMSSGRTRWPDAGDRSAAGVSESLTGRVAGNGSQQTSAAAPDRDSTATEGRPFTDPTHLTTGAGEVNRVVGRSSAQAVGSFEHGHGGLEGVGKSGFPINPPAPGPASTTAAGDRTPANGGTGGATAINPSAQVLGGTATAVGAANNAGVNFNAASTSSQAIGSPSSASNATGAGASGQTVGGPSSAGNATAQTPGVGASSPMAGGAGITSSTPGAGTSSQMAGSTPGASTSGSMAGGAGIASSIPGVGASSPMAGGAGIASSIPGAGTSSPMAGGAGIASSTPGAGASSPMAGSTPGAGTSSPMAGGAGIASSTPGAGASGPAVGGSNSLSSTTAQTAVGTINAAGTNASSQAIGGLNSANNLAVANTMSQIVSVAVLNQVLGAPSNTGAAAIKNSPTTSDNTPLAVSSDRGLLGDPTGTNLPGVKVGVLSATNGTRLPLPDGGIADPTRSQATLPPVLPQPVINASDQVRQDAGIGTAGGVTDHLLAPLPVPVPEPSPLALLGAVAVVSAGRLILRCVRHRGEGVKSAATRR